DLAISHQQLTVPARPHRHAHEHVLALEGFHPLHSFHRQLSFPALGVADREYRRPRGEIESGPVPLDSMGFTYVRLLTLPQGNSAGNSLRPRPPDLHVLEVKPPGRKLPYAVLGRRPARHEVGMGGRTGLGRLRLGLARDSYGDFSVVNPHRQVRHQGALDIPHHLLGRQLSRGRPVDLLDRPAVTLDDFGGDYPRKRKDELLSTLNREYAAGDV